ncbi:MAG TPA: ATP-binding protein [Candidatus Acidoferrales bacterium]|nr:ATP-binding protein [Candidatus Acidoferrales bacterium]
MTPNFRAAFSGERRNVPLARNAIAGFARICGFSNEEIADIRVASGEALSNAVEHGRARHSSGFSVRCSFDDDRLTIEIRDNGDGFLPPATLVAPSPFDESERGYGILLMRRLMDGVQFERNGTLVRLVRQRSNPTAAV